MHAFYKYCKSTSNRGAPINPRSIIIKISAVVGTSDKDAVLLVSN